MKRRFLEAGKIVSTSGLKGEVRVNPWCDSPDFLLRFAALYFDGGKKPVVVEYGRVQKNMAILKLAGIDTVDQANSLRGKVLWVSREDVELPEGTYFIEDIIGLTVVDAEDAGIVYGTLSDVSHTGANDVYHVEKDGRTVLIPAIRQVVIATDLEAGIMRIRPLEGLFDDAD